MPAKAPKQQTREEVISNVTSDHVCKKYQIKLKNSENAETEIGIATWNVLQKMKGKGPGNNPWKYQEKGANASEKKVNEYNERKKTQLSKIKDLSQSCGIICLQETNDYSDQELNKIIKSLNNNSSSDDWSYERVGKDNNAKFLVTLYDKNKYEIAGNKYTVLDNKGLFLGYQITFRDKKTRQQFNVVNTHNAFGTDSKANTDHYFTTHKKHDKNKTPAISIGDMNHDYQHFNNPAYATVSCGKPTNFDGQRDSATGDLDRSDTSFKDTKDKCYDMAHIYLPNGFNAIVTETGQYFEESLKTKDAEITFQLTGKDNGVEKQEIRTKTNTPNPSGSPRPNRKINIKEIENYINNNSSDPSDQSLKSFKEKIDAQTNNPNPKGPYRGIGVKVETTNEGLVINEIFSPSVKRFRNTKSNKEIDLEIGSVIIGICSKTDGSYQKITSSTSSEEIAGFFHQEKNISFQVMKKDGSVIEVTCNNTKNKTAIFSPTKDKQSFESFSEVLTKDKTWANNIISETISATSPLSKSSSSKVAVKKTGVGR